MSAVSKIKLTLKPQRPFLNHIDTTKLMKPVLKWVGGKTQIIGDILKRFPSTMNSYHEPFVGAGSVLLAMLSCQKAGIVTINNGVYASDINIHVVSLFQNIQKYPQEFIVEVKTIIAECARAHVSDTEDEDKRNTNLNPKNLEEALTSRGSYYYWIRQQFNKVDATQRSSIRSSAMFIFMNKTGFRGLYREGPNGYNVPYGNNKNPTIINEDYILSVSELIREVIFTHQSFEVALDHVTSGDFVYLDPPYAPENKKSFVGYNSGGFSYQQHQQLFAKCQDFRAINVGMLMSNSDVKMVHDAFPPPIFQTQVIVCRRAINSKCPSATTNEVMITFSL